MMSPIKCITIEEELKKNPELKLSDMQILREWCKEQPHLPKIQDVELAIFLHNTYYHIESTKKMVENYYTCRTHMPELFSNRDILKEKRLRDAFKTVAHFQLESKTKEEYSIMIARLIDMNPSCIFQNELLNAALMTYEEFLWTHGSTPGQIIVIDITGYTIGHLKRINVATIKKVIYYIQNAAPTRLKGIHVINTSPIFKIAFNMIKHFIYEKMRNLIHLHSSLQSVSEYFPLEVLPNECGGKAGPIQELMDTHLKRIENFREWFLKDEKNNRVNESLRSKKL